MPVTKMLPKPSAQRNLLSTRRLSARRFLSSSPSPSPNPGANRRARLQKLNDRLPAYLRAYTTPLIGAPAIHITSFLVLHEITAVVPLFGIFGVLYYSGWMPLLDTGKQTTLDEAIQRFGRWMTRKGWVGSEDVETAKAASATTMDDEKSQMIAQQKGAQIVLQFATAYVVTKALFPLRIIASVLATPWFARVVVGPIGKGVMVVFRRK